MQRTNLFYNVVVNSQLGFLPPPHSATLLPDGSEFNTEINRIVSSLPTLLANKTLRAEIDSLDKRFPHPEVVLTKGDQAQKRLALLFLSSLAHAYVFENPDLPIAALPQAIAKPFYALCKSKQRFATITYSDYILNNWYLIDESQPISLDNIEPILTFTLTQDEAWFIKIHVVIESIAISAISALQNAYFEAEKPNPEAALLIQYFDEIQTSLNDVIDIMHRMNEHCHPSVFWNTLRPYLSGYEKAKPLGSEDPGVYFAGINSKDKKPFSYSGPSGAQSSIVPALDAGLRIKHEIDGMYRKLLEFEEYMPNEHQRFIKQLTNSKIKHVVKTLNNDKLSTCFEATIAAVKKMRGAHMGLVHQYIYQPAAQQGIPRDVITGTGGAPIESYLAERYTQTRARIRR